MERASESGRDPRLERLRKRAVILGLIERHSASDPAKLRAHVYVSDSELGEILTEMIRRREVDYFISPKGKIELSLTASGLAEYQRIKDFAHQPAD